MFSLCSDFMFFLYLLDLCLTLDRFIQKRQKWLTVISYLAESGPFEVRPSANFLLKWTEVVSCTFLLPVFSAITKTALSWISFTKAVLIVDLSISSVWFVCWLILAGILVFVLFLFLLNGSSVRRQLVSWYNAITYSLTEGFIPVYRADFSALQFCWQCSWLDRLEMISWLTEQYSMNHCTSTNNEMLPNVPCFKMSRFAVIFVGHSVCRCKVK